MGFFDPEDVESADIDPFGLPVGNRIEAVISASALEKIGKAEYPGWVITFSKGNRNQRLVHFLTAKDEEGKDRNMGRIHKTLQLLEIPRDEWDEVSENPDLLVGTEVIVEVKMDKNGYKRVELVGLSRGEPSDDAMTEFMGTESENAYGM